MFVFMITLNKVHSRPAKGVEKRQFGKAAVATDIPECSELATSILKEGGSAVDAAITSILYIGLVNGQTSGIGGGSFMLLYDRKSKNAEYIDARVSAPAATTRDMYNHNHISNKYGALAIATPGEVKGMWEAHQKYGKLSWKRLFEPVIELARRGFKVTNHGAMSLKLLVEMAGEGPQNHVLGIMLLSFVFKAWKDLYFKNNGARPKEEGDIVIRSNYADTLQRIADNGWTEFYNGTTADMIIEDMKLYNGILTKADLQNYNVRWSDVITTPFLGNTIYSPSLPSGGVLNQLASKDFAKEIQDKINSELEYPKIEFATKNQNTNDVGNAGSTSHVSILAENGDAVSVTTSVNFYYGCKIMSATSGIIYNSMMSNFTIPNMPTNGGKAIAEANYPAPNKRPLSTMCGSFILDKNDDVRFVIGSSGGNQIITANAWVTLVTLATDTSLMQAIEWHRIHTDYEEEGVSYEDGVPQTVITGLLELGHNIKPIDKRSFAVVQAILKDKSGIDTVITGLLELGHNIKPIDKRSFAVVQAILKDKSGIDAYSDSRKLGKPAGY
ncbi:scoloptoxin SSD14-like [Antedon mediterranea]|uniref:scoloptoxin SSD14-like n=1 Tax=Antedon mediterranea TaxID=105859 RepID=UPI003AF789E8